MLDKELGKEYLNDNCDATQEFYSGGYKRAFSDIQEELGMEYDKD